MKTLELNLNKRLLIVETGEIEEIIDIKADFNIKDLEGKKFIPVRSNMKLLCTGSELNEEFLSNTDLMEETKLFVSLGDREHRFKSYNGKCGFRFRIESFISAIESNGWYWGENPVKFNDDEADFKKRHKNRIDWELAERRTFKPEKCIIFEIL